MDLMRIAAFSDNLTGGNPAGVLISDQHPSDAEMQSIAADVGYSETAFAMPLTDNWRVRYFSPETEVPFCGHATIALGAALTSIHGAQVFPLQLNEANISVEGMQDGEQYLAALQSPPTKSDSATTKMVSDMLELFDYRTTDLDPKLAPAIANAGANFLVVGLKTRDALRNMTYNLDAGRTFMRRENLITVMFVHAEDDYTFHVRNAFASGGVIEDPATGAAAAAFAGYLRDISWAHNGSINIVQGEDMGSRSLIKAEIGEKLGESIRVSGSARFIA